MSDDINFNKPMAGVLEESLKERMIKEIQHKRQWWYVQRYHYLQDRPGGSRYEMRVLDGDQKTADEQAKLSQEHFERYSKECMMNLDGTSMDPELPVIEMQKDALKNQKRLIANFINRHMQQLYRMLLGLKSVDEAMLVFFFDGMAQRYEIDLYEQAHLIMDNLNIPFITSYDFKLQMEKVAKAHAGRYMLGVDESTKKSEAKRCIEELGLEIRTYVQRPITDALNKLDAENQKPVLTTDTPAGPVLH